ncbi:MAG: carboxy-S-adenosyl-L-methionine synthase CmoA [Pseudomonadales bacterium]
MTRDQIYSSPLGKISGFEFDQRVVDVFPDMIQRSVPGYESIIAMTGTLASECVVPATNCYDLGCSLGASTLSISAEIPESCKVIAVDNSEAMIGELGKILESQPEKNQIELRLADIRDVEISNASLVVLNFTMQFVPVDDRLNLLKNIYAGMIDGGLLMVSEKIKITDARLNQIFINAHHEFKRRQGYSDLEIAQKRTAIENVLIPETIPEHEQRFAKAGFKSSGIWFQCLNFCSMIAVK